MNSNAGCRTCNFRDCALEKSVAHCVDCADYPCKMYRKWQSAAKFLPHVREAASSMEAIKRDSVDLWLAAQKKRWSCPDCGAPAEGIVSAALERLSGATCSRCCSSGNFVRLIGVRVLEVFHVAAEWSGSCHIAFGHDQFRRNGRSFRDNLPAVKGVIATEPTRLPLRRQIPAQGKTEFIFESIRDLIEKAIKSRPPI